MTVCYWCGSKDTLADVGKELDDGKYKMVQCSKCKNAYYVVNKEKMNKQKPQTNEEWFCSLSTEEKAKTIVCLEVNALHKWKEGLVEDDVAEIKRWLKEIHE